MRDAMHGYRYVLVLFNCVLADEMMLTADEM